MTTRFDEIKYDTNKLVSLRIDQIEYLDLLHASHHALLMASKEFMETHKMKFGNTNKEDEAKLYHAIRAAEELEG